MVQSSEVSQSSIGGASGSCLPFPPYPTDILSPGPGEIQLAMYGAVPPGMETLISESLQWPNASLLWGGGRGDWSGAGGTCQMAFLKAHGVCLAYKALL